MKKNDNNLLLLGAAAAAIYFLMPKKAAADTNPDTIVFDEPSKNLMRPGGNDTGFRPKILPGYGSDVTIDTIRDKSSSVLDKVNMAKEVLESVSNAEISIKTPKGTLNIFKGKGKRKRNKNAASATINSENLPDLLNTVADTASDSDPRNRNTATKKIISKANKHARNVKKGKRPVKKSGRKKPVSKKPKLKKVRVKHINGL